LDFGAGTNVIVGVMGSGKSSIVNAISYGLFGTFPALKNKSVSLKEIIMNKPNAESRAEIEVSFTHGEHNFKAERIIKTDGTNEAKLYENDRLVAGPKQKDVNERIEKELGMSYELFSRAVYAEQNEMDFFLKLSPAERKRKFDELLELEKYETVRKNATTLQNDLVKENKQRKDFIEQQKETIKSYEEEKLTKQIAQETSAIKELTSELVKMRKDSVELEKKYTELASKEKKHKELEDQLLRNSSKAETLREGVARSEKLSIKEITDAIEIHKKEITGSEEKLKVVLKELKSAEDAAKKAAEEMRVLEYRKRELVNEEKEIKSLKGTCPKCKQEMNETHHKSMLTKVETESKKVEEELTKVQKEAIVLRGKVESFEKEENVLDKKVDEGRKALYKLESLAVQAKELEEKKKELEKLSLEAPKIKESINAVGFDKNVLDKTRNEYFGKKEDASVTETKIKSKEDLVKSYESTLTKIGLIKENIKETEKLLTNTDDAAKKLGIFSNCLVATQGELREELLCTINSAMTNIWEAVYPYRDFTSARLCVVEDGYDLQVLTRNNEWTRVEGILSGGERSAAALCIRVAFALVLTKNLSMLILDEPTHNLDTNAVAKLSEMLRENLPKLVTQIFVITHDKQLEAAASSNLYLLTRDKNADEATKVETVPVE